MKEKEKAKNTKDTKKKKQTKGPTKRKWKTTKKQIPKVVESVPEEHTTTKVNLDDIVYNDETFCYRFNLNTSDLEKSIQTEGQQIPVILRPHPEQDKKYQIISGFRRLTAIKNLDLKDVIATIRKDIDDNFKALKVSVIENEKRKSYTTLDRALAVVKGRQAGRKWKDLESLFGLSRMHLDRLQKLADLPEALADALKANTITATHTAVLASFKSKWDSLDLAKWVKKIAKEELSVSDLSEALDKEYKKDKKPFVLFNEAKEGVFQVRKLTLKQGNKEAIEQVEELLRMLKEKV